MNITEESLTELFQSIEPPLAVQQRGLARFLSDARGRKRLMDLRESERPVLLRDSWTWALGLLSFALLVLTVGVLGWP